MTYSQSEVEKLFSDNPDLRVDTTGIDNVNFIKKQRSKKPIPERTSKPVGQTLPTEGTKRHTIIKMPYPGSVITENHYLGRNGKNSYVKPEVREWKNDLIALVNNCGIKDWKLPLKIRVEGTFKNLRECPDLHNLKCLYDGIQEATGLNDKNYYTETIPGVIDKSKSPFILITISEI